jgi:predicted lipoprotein with Yx(FWY)xxD motif
MDHGRRTWGRGAAILAQSALAAAGVTAALTTALITPAGASTSHTLTVKTAQVPKVGVVLTTGSGLTLYRYVSDPKGKATCTGVCAKLWPPLLLPKGDHLSGPRGLKGLSSIAVAHGHRQVTFDGVALYRFTSDTKPGQAKGQGVAGKFFAVLKSGIPVTAHVSTPTAPPVTTAPPTTPTTPATTPATTPVTAPPTTQPQSAPTPETQPTMAPTTTPTTAQPAPTGGAGF